MGKDGAIAGHRSSRACSPEKHAHWACTGEEHHGVRTLTQRMDSSRHSVRSAPSDTTCPEGIHGRRTARALHRWRLSRAVQRMAARKTSLWRTSRRNIGWMPKKKSPPDLPGGSTTRPFSRWQWPAQRGPALPTVYGMFAARRQRELRLRPAVRQELLQTIRSIGGFPGAIDWGHAPS